ncbi:phosphoenolpyruvate-utilizing N-terminal domain-containing protein, partial [Mycobacterium tuberculosis]|uniref:phosphoenolpyruvate-utilizing N-terminal domain-containing protein n=1 Tax=Mycobacterium tuberculosis TaxID=1773 RepID=UPI003266F4D6
MVATNEMGGDLHYVRQGDPKGLGHAVLRAKRHVGDEAFAVLLGDGLIDEKEDLLARAEHASRDGKAVLKSTSQMATDRALIKSAIKLVETQEMAPERAIWEAATSFADQMAALGGY